MKRFLEQYNSSITGVVSCFDRILIRGSLPLTWGDAMEGLLARNGLLIKDFGKFVNAHSQRVVEHAKRVAQQAQRPYVYLNGGSHRKEDLVRAILQNAPVRQGLVCVLGAVEACQSFKMVPGKGRPRLLPTRRKCLCLYFYFLEPDLGLVHIRIQSWFPLTVQICLNGHEILARQLDRHGIDYHKADNAFTWIADPKRAQELADGIAQMPWPRLLGGLVRRANPLLGNLLRGMGYYFTIDQAEYATDVMFKDAVTLKPLYEKLVKHATLCFSAEDVLTFLGRKLHPAFAGEVLTDFQKKRWPGARVKHRMKQNWIKMYDKHGSVLRIETVIHQPAEFKVRRRGTRCGQTVVDWFPLRKGVANLFRYAEVSRAANGRYLDALSAVEPPGEWPKLLRRLARPARQRGRSYRGFNPALEEDIELFVAVLRGEHSLHGFRNEDLRQQFFAPQSDVGLRRRQANKISRSFQRLHAHGLIAKIPRTRRWRVTHPGNVLISAVLKCHYEKYPELLAAKAA